MDTKREGARRLAVLRLAGMALAVGLGVSACASAGSVSEADADKDEAIQLADQLNERLAAEGLPEVDQETARALYGVDGGVSCENAGNLQQELGLFQFGNNSLHWRRVVLDPSLANYDLAVIETYCPDKADDYEEVLEDLDTEETIPTP